MASAYRPYALVTNDGTIVALMHIESISQASRGEEAVVDKLKGDLTFNVTTVSGYIHTISIKRLVAAYKKDCRFDDDMHETYLAILERWIHLLGTV
jgi:hypothetical protein